MTDHSMQVLIDAASGYDSSLVPALFEQWPPLIADAAAIKPGAHVLDVACGTGVLARAIADRVGKAGSVTGIDPGAGMLAVAARRAPGIEWHEGVAEALPFPDTSFDAVVSQFGFMFFADKLTAAKEMLRVLKPGGHLAVAVWDSLEHNPAYEHEVHIIERIAGRAAADCVRAPFSLGDKTEFERAFPCEAVATVTTHSGTGRFSSVDAMLEADLRGWLPVLGITLSEATIQEILIEARQALARYVRDDGRVEFETSAHILTGTRA